MQNPATPMKLTKGNLTKLLNRGSPEEGAVCITRKEKEENSYLDKGGPFPHRSLLPAFKEGSALPTQKQCTDHVLEPMRKHHNLEVFSNELLLKNPPQFPPKIKLTFLCLFQLAYGLP